jgi:CHAT domain-containing protein/Tfp pilus assembly protein PilF
LLTSAFLPADAGADEPPVPARDERKEKLKQRERYLSEYRAMLRDGKLALAAEALEKALALEQQIFGPVHANVDASLRNLADVHKKREDFPAAKKCLQQSLELRRKLYGANHWRVIDSGWALRHLEQWAQSDAKQRQDLGEAARLMAQVVDLERRGQVSQALAPCKQALDIYDGMKRQADPAYASCLHWLAWLWHCQQDFSKTEPLYQKALEIRTETLGAQHPSYAQTLHNLGLLYLVQGSYDKAEAVFKKAVASRKKALGEGHADYGYSLHFLGVVYHVQKKFSDAEALYRQALATRKQLLGGQHADYTQTLHNLAALYEAQRDFAKAERRYREAMEIRKKVLGSAHPDYAHSVHMLAGVYHAQGNYARAEPLYLEALALRKQALGETHADYLLTMNNLGLLHREQGDYVQAERLFQQALDTRRKTLPATHADIAQSLFNLAGLHQLQGDYARAEPLYQQAERILKKALGDTHPDYLSLLNNLAVLYKDQGDFAKAEPLFRQTLEVRRRIVGDKHPDFAETLHNLAGLYQMQGETAKAEPLLQQAVAIFKNPSGTPHPYYADCLNNLAVLYRDQRAFAKAEDLFRETLKVHRKNVGETHPAYAETLYNLAGLYQLQGQLDRAEPLYRESLDIRTKALGEAHPACADEMTDLAGLYWARGDLAKAETYLQRSLRISRDNLDLAAQSLAERQQLAMTRLLRGRLDDYLSFVVHTRRPPDLVYGDVLAWKGAVFLRQRRQRDLRQVLVARPDPELQKLFADLENTSRQLARLAFAVPAPQQQAGWRKRLSELTEEKERLEITLARRSAAFQKERERARLTARHIQKVLPAGVALIDVLEYRHSQPSKPHKGRFEFESRVLAFVVRAEKPLQVVEFGPAAKLNSAVESWRRSIRSSTPQSGDSEASLRRLFLDPLGEHLDGVHTVLVSPDGALTAVPLGALPGTKPGTFWIEDMASVVVPTPQLLPELLAAGPKTAAGPPSLLLVGDVDFGADPGKTKGQTAIAAARAGEAGGLHAWKALPGTRGEMLAIRQAFEKSQQGRVTSLDQARATEAAVSQEAARHRWLHLATHGFFAPEKLHTSFGPRTKSGEDGTGLLDREGVAGFHPGLLSGLVLAGANRLATQGQADGILSALEVAELDLSKVELVVLSACETGLGKTAGGEGVLGLQRAFQIAGAKTTVASLWSVPDEATRELMARFYANLWDKTGARSKLRALREAQLWMLREGWTRPGVRRGAEREDTPPAYASGRLPPYYWAAFVLSGNWK